MIEDTPQPVLDDMNSKYHTYAQLFVDKHDFEGRSDLETHWQKVQEEFRELDDEVDEYIYGPEGVADVDGELADVIHALFVLGQMLDDVDVRSAFELKAEYNLQKSTERDERGFVTDDA